ncbi:MAG: protein kinase [Deltaproteobacteria bacterium]|nr:protein kinase [Deltaproteobacteria bacterium]
MVEHRPSLLPPPLGTLLDGRYRLDRLIGQGGMGAVYEACTPEGEPVAVKLLLEIPRSKRGTLTISRFLREAKLMADLDSPHIVPALDAGWDDALGLPFLVLPLLRGLDLADLLAKLEVLSPQLAVRIACQACRALVAAHEAGVVHRDIKPENLFLDHDEQGRINVRVLDFGIAKSLAEDGQLTATGNVMGTPHYMSPEQALSSKHVDGRTDVWSLGATLYRALCGEVPFGLAATPTEVLLALHTRPVPALQSQAPWIEPELAAVVHGALIRDPAARCPSAAALLAALEPHAGGSTTLCADMLASLPAELRTRQAVLAELPDRWPEPSASETAAELPGREPDPLLGKVLGDRFTLTRVMGRGGMGSVYEAEAAGGGRVAVKVIEEQWPPRPSPSFSGKPAAASPPPTPSGWCTATSSPPTCSCTRCRTARCGSRSATSASPST